MKRLLQLRGVTRAYGAVRAVDQVTLDITTGARHALIGPNGAGKSTMVHLIAGTVSPTSGQILFDGTDITRLPAHRRGRAGIGRTWQHPAVYEPLTALDNVVLAVPGQRLTAGRRHRLAITPALRALTMVGLAGHADTPTAQLPYGDRRLLELAIALAGQPRLLLLDEPSAGLSTTDTTRLTELIRGLPDTITVLLIDHNLDLVFDIADTVTVIHHGRLITTGSPGHVRDHPEVRRAYLPVNARPDEPPTRPSPKDRQTPPVLAVRDLTAAHTGPPVLAGIDLDLHPGQVIAVVGRNGAGKTTLINTIAGLHPATPPTAITITGATITGHTPRQRLRAGLALVPQGRRLFTTLTVDEHLTIPTPPRRRPAPFTRADVLDLLPALADRRRHRPHQLSGGEQQMLALARALLTGPRVLLLDEPSEGLAPTVVAQVATIIGDLAASGVAVLIAEQNLSLALAVADQVCVLHRGSIALRAPAADLRADPTPMEHLLAIPPDLVPTAPPGRTPTP
jgi:ABC-type branched-subunit amino acid transport system ATPase component